MLSSKFVYDHYNVLHECGKRIGVIFLALLPKTNKTKNIVGNINNYTMISPIIYIYTELLPSI